MNKRYKYQEIAEQIKMDIFENHQVPNKPLPSIREYARLNQVNPHTISCALRLLKEEGIIYISRGNGYCVTDNIKELKWMLAQTTTKELICTLSELGYEKEEVLIFIRDFLKTMTTP